VSLPVTTTESNASPATRLAEFHALAGHAGPANGCQKCAAQSRRQRSAAAALRTQQRQTRQQIDTILRKAAI
jgi:hypothetical protein